MIPAGYQVDLAPRADADLRRLVGKQAGPLSPHLNEMLRTIFAAFDSLGDVPRRALVDPQPPGRNPPVGSLPVPPYMVYRRVYDADRLVRITRVRHGARQPLRRFA